MIRSIPIPAILLSFCMLFTMPLCAQKNFELPKTREVIINQGDSTIKASILYSEQKKIRTRDNRMYHWYAANAIQHNIGDYEGKLLYGDYKIFDRYNHLLLKGKLKKGLKDGKWTEWYSDGKIRSVIHWKKGLMHGRQRHYDPAGKLTEESKFRRGEKRGVIKEFDGKEGYNKVKYVDLKEVPKEKGKTGKKEIKEKKEKGSLFGKNDKKNTKTDINKPKKEKKDKKGFGLFKKEPKKEKPPAKEKKPKNQ